MTAADRRDSIAILVVRATREADRCARAGDRGAERSWLAVARCCWDYGDGEILRMLALLPGGAA